MSVLIFSLEGWIMSIIGLAWRAIRNSIFPISYLEDYILYVQLALSSLNIFFCAIFNDKRPTVASYFTLTFNLWLFTLMVGADSWDEYTLDNWNTNITVSNTTCCPNNKYYAWTRQVYFAGSPLYLAPLAVTLALQVSSFYHLFLLL